MIAFNDTPGELAVPEADRQLAPIQVVLNREDHGKGSDRQSDPSHGWASEKLPALFLRDQVFAHLHPGRLGTLRWRSEGRKTSGPLTKVTPVAPAASLTTGRQSGPLGHAPEPQRLGIARSR
jgi:hypothetical protein